MTKSNINPLLSDFDNRMEIAVENLTKEFSGLRTNRASASLLDTIKVEVYGSFMPIQQVGTISVPEARMLVVQVWDKSMVKAVEKAIRESDLGLNPSSEGQNIRIPMPSLSEERRQDLVKVASRFAEESKVAIRNVRRDAMEMLKKQEKANEITEDDLRKLSDDVQKITDLHTKVIDDLLAKKQKDIMMV